jgi:arylsulfatase A-like enzyme
MNLLKSSKIIILSSLALILIVFLFISYFYYKCYYIPPPEKIILILLDAARADHFSLFGYPKITVPNLKKYFDDFGVAFSNNYSQSVGTRRSVPQLMTGKYYPKIYIGIETIPVFEQLAERDSKEITLPEIFQQNHFYTALFSAHPYIFTQNSVLSNYFNEAHNIINEKKPKAQFEDINNIFLPWLEKNKEKRFFVYIHAMDTHFPHAADIDNLAKFMPKITQEIYSKIQKKIITGTINEKNFNYEDREIINALYDTDLYYADKYIANIFRKLIELNILKKTLLIICADHGEELLEIGRSGHYTTLNYWTLHTPLLFLYSHFKASSRLINDFSENIDIFPSLLNLCKIKLKAKNIDGKSLVQYFRKKPLFGNFIHKKGVFATTQYQKNLEVGEVFISQPFSIMRYKSPSNNIEFSFFNIKTNPNFDNDPKIPSKLRSALENSLNSYLSKYKIYNNICFSNPSPIELTYQFRLEDIQNKELVTTDISQMGAIDGKWYLNEGFDGNPFIMATLQEKIQEVRITLPIPLGEYYIFADVLSSKGSPSRHPQSSFEIKFSESSNYIKCISSNFNKDIETIFVGKINFLQIPASIIIRKQSQEMAALIYRLRFIPVKIMQKNKNNLEIDLIEKLRALGYIH